MKMTVLTLFVVDPQFEKHKSERMATNVSTIDMNYTLNGSYFNQSDDKHDHHSAYYKLYSFLTYLSFYWAVGGIQGTVFFLKLIYTLYTYFSSKETSSEETTETIKKTQRDSKFLTFLLWLYFVPNSMILWMDIVAMVYCYGGFLRNCPLSDNDLPYVSFFVGVGCAYIMILFAVSVAALDILGRENISNADVHDALVELMHREKPVVKWTTNENDDEEDSVKFEKWKTSVWKEGIFGFHQVSPEVATGSVFTTIGHPRLTITTYVCTDDQVTRQKWLNKRQALKGRLKKKLNEDRCSVRAYFVRNSSFIPCNSQKVLMLSFCVLSFLLGLAVLYRMVVYFFLPEEHYILYKTVYSDGDDEPPPIESRDSVELPTLTAESHTSDTLSLANCDYNAKFQALC